MYPIEEFQKDTTKEKKAFVFGSKPDDVISF